MLLTLWRQTTSVLNGVYPGYRDHRLFFSGLSGSRQLFASWLLRCDPHSRVSSLSFTAATRSPADNIFSFVFPGFLIPAFFLGFAYYQLAIGYLNTGRDLRRMESNSRSPIFSDFGELLEGIVTVRAFSAELRFLNNLHKEIDSTTKVTFLRVPR